MPGTRAQAKNTVNVITGYSNAAVTASQFLTEFVCVSFARITGIKVYASTAGTGGATTVVDVLVNGASIWATAGNKPTLLATATGEFANAVGDPGKVGVRPGDRVAIQVLSISSTGHARLMATVALEGNA
jgi:hypothetical protein